MQSLVAVITTMVEQTAVLEAEVNQCFGQHPDAEIITSQPGLGMILGLCLRHGQLVNAGLRQERTAAAVARLRTHEDAPDLPPGLEPRT